MFREPQAFEAQTTLKTLEGESSASLEKALVAYQDQRLDLRFAGDTGVEHLSEDPSTAKAQIQSLFDKGYELFQDAQAGFYLSRGLLGGMMAETPIAALEKKLDMKPEGKLSVFITYQWAQKDIAIAIHEAFAAKGFLVIRDEDTLHNGVYIQDFMKIITHPKLDYVLPVISASYLKSKNCMYEVNQIMKRHHWESSLLPYVVTKDDSANAHIYSGVASYEDYWQEQLTQPEGLRNRQLFKNILRNIRPFTTAITTRIQIPEGELIASGYQALFETVSQREAGREGARFREIEELLRIAAFDENMEDHEAVKQSFESAIAKIKEMKAVQGINNISAKVYGLYGEYLFREDNQKEGERYLRIAKKFGFKPSDTSEILSADVARLSVEPASPAKVVIPQAVSSPVPADPTPSVSSSASATGKQAPASNVLIFTPPKPSIAVAPSVNPQEISQLLSLVAQGEQSKAETMIQKNPALLLARGTVNDLAGRNFKGVHPDIAKRGGNGVREFKDITALQYSVWALDWHMWKMLLKYLPPEEAKLQALEFETGPWVRTHGAHAGPQLQGLITALKTYIDNYKPWSGEQCKTHWIQQVGGAQLLLPAHVMNEYCHPTRSFDPCPNFEKDEDLPRTRKVTIDKDYEDLFTAQWNGGSLGNSFGLAQCGGAGGWGEVGMWLRVWGDRSRPDHASITSLCSTRTQQRDRLITELGNSSTLKSTVAGRK